MKSMQEVTPKANKPGSPDIVYAQHYDMSYAPQKAAQQPPQQSPARMPGSPGTTLTFNQTGNFIGDSNNKTKYIAQGYERSATVFSVVRYIAEKAGSVKVNVFRKTGDVKAFTAYQVAREKGWHLDPVRKGQYENLRAKAMEPVPDTHPLVKLLQRPNPIMGQGLFTEGSVGYKLLTGAATIWANRGPLNGAPLELWLLPSQNVTIIADPNDMFMPVGYQVIMDGKIWNIPRENIMYWKFQNYNVASDGSHLYGMPPLKSAWRDIRLEEKTADGKEAHIDNQGAKGVVYVADPQAPPLSPTERDELQLKFNQQINGKFNSNRVAVANVQLGYLNLGAQYDQLGFDKMDQSAKENIYNVLKFPPVLLSTDAATYDNIKNANKQLVTNNIMPMIDGFYDEMNNWLPKLFGDELLYMEPDYSVLPEMQDDLATATTTISKLWQLTPNQVLEYLGFETDPTNEAMETVYAPSSIVKLQDIYDSVANVGNVNAAAAAQDALQQSGNNDY